MSQKQLPVVSSEGLPGTGQRRCLSEISFEEAFSNSPDFLLALRDRAKTKIAGVLGLAQDVVRTVTIRDGGGYDLVLAPEALKGLRSRRLEPYYDPKTGHLDPTLRDQRGKFAARGKLAPRSGQVAARAVVAAAHLVADLDTQAKLQAIEAKLDALLRQIRAQRVGELRGLYNRVRSLLGQEHPAETDFASVKTELDKLAGSFFETAKLEFEAIKDPTDIGFFQAALSLQTSAEDGLRSQLRSGYADLRGWAFSIFLLRQLTTEHEGVEALGILNRRQCEEAGVLLQIAAEKWGYMDLGVQQRMSEQLEIYNSQLAVGTTADVYVAVEKSPKG